MSKGPSRLEVANKPSRVQDLVTELEEILRAGTAGGDDDDRHSHQLRTQACGDHGILEASVALHRRIAGP
eukprot:3239820-Amphidinium_carterae.1